MRRFPTGPSLTDGDTGLNPAPSRPAYTNLLQAQEEELDRRHMRTLIRLAVAIVVTSLVFAAYIVLHHH